MPRVHARHLDAHRARRRGPAALPRVHGRAVQGADAQDVRRQDAPHAGARALARSNPPSPTLTRTDSEWLSSQLLFFKSLFDVAAARKRVTEDNARRENPLPMSDLADEEEKALDALKRQARRDARPARAHHRCDGAAQ